MALESSFRVTLRSSGSVRRSDSPLRRASPGPANMLRCRIGFNHRPIIAHTRGGQRSGTISHAVSAVLRTAPVAIDCNVASVCAAPLFSLSRRRVVIDGGSIC